MRGAALLAATTFTATLATQHAALAEREAPVDVVVHEPAPPRRPVSVEWNPLPLFTIGKLSANIVVAPIDHHAIVLSPFYAWTTTVPIRTFDDDGRPTQLPEQSFKGFGGELGYRYYTGEGGPRGLFVGPSVIVAYFEARASDGEKTPFLDFGVAADAGYQILLADRVALSLGGGVQYIWTGKSIPDQQFPARFYANRGVAPRLLLSLGWAF